MKRFILLASLLVLASACGDENGTNPGDTTPPATVADLVVADVSGDAVTLQWTAPGDDGAEGGASAYDIRYAATALTEETWDAATPVASPPEPGAAAGTESFVVSGLSDGTWYFGLKAADEVPNWSALSNVVSATVVDDVPPAPVEDLSVDSVTGTKVTLSWTAPGDDGDLGNASEYDLRYAQETITNEMWDAAIRVDGVPAPAPPGSLENFEVSSLEPAETYFFALRAADGVPNWSELSNVVEAETASTWQLTNEGGFATAPSWSPDGEQIVYAAVREGNRDLYRIDVSGGEPVRLTDDPAVDDLPAWSPLGDKIAFVSDRDGGDFGLWVVDADGESEPVLLAQHQGERVHEISWSPDGARIAYQLPFGGQLISATDIYVIPAAGGTPEVLIEGGASWGNWNPAWSPDGESMAILSTRSFSWDLWIVPLAGGEWLRLTTTGLPTSNLIASWSPDGTELVFDSNRGGNFDIYRVPSGGGAAVQVTFDPALDSHPTWSPAGDRIAFTSNRSGGTEVWIQILE